MIIRPGSRKPFRISLSRFLSRLGLGIMVQLLILASVQAQAAPSASPSTAPVLTLNPGPDQVETRTHVTSPALLISGFVFAAGGTTVWLYGSQFKSEYDTAYAAWKADPSGHGDQLTRAQGKFFVPLFTGMGLLVVSAFLIGAGFDTGGGTQAYSEVDPLSFSRRSGPSVMAYLGPGSVGILIK